MGRKTKKVVRMSKLLRRFFVFSVFSALLALVFAAVASAQTVPHPPVITVGEGGKYISTPSGLALPAVAGNVTNLVVTDVSVTQFWQGYFGNVTCTITFD